MVDCTKCKRSKIWNACFPKYDYKMVYCEFMDESISYNQAKEDLPCDMYDEKLDDNETEESSA